MDPVQLFIILDEDLDLNNIVNNVIEDLGHPIEHIGDRRRNVRPRNENYYELTIPQYTDVQFIEHFRMSRRTFEELLNVIAPLANNMENMNVDISKKLMFTIWILAKPESFLAASDRFGLPKSTGHQIFKNITNVLAQLIPQYIKWPAIAERQLSCEIFENRSHGFPGVIGAIDGCHIPCKQPIGNANDYYNRKNFHSIILQGVCDHTGSFIDCFIGMPGRMHDSRVFRMSPLFRAMNAERPLIPRNQHLIGDSAYPLLCNLMTPFRDNGHLTRLQSTYNVKLSSIRSIIERSFGLLKTKFRRLKYLDISDFDLGLKMIAAACVLHNFIIKGDELNVQDEDLQLDDNVHAEIQLNNVHEEIVEAIEKRRRIVERF